MLGQGRLEAEDALVGLERRVVGLDLGLWVLGSMLDLLVG